MLNQCCCDVELMLQTLFLLMFFPIQNDTVRMGLSTIYFKRSQGRTPKYYIFLPLKIVYISANSVDPDKMAVEIFISANSVDPDEMAVEILRKLCRS